MFFISRRNAAPVFEPIEAALDYVSAAVPFTINRDDAFACTSRWNNRRYAAFSEAISDLVAVICLVSGKICGAQARPTATNSLDFAQVHELQELRRVVRFAAREREGDGIATTISSQMHLRSKATSAASKRARSPFFPPAACWWARMTVLSMQCVSQSRSPCASAISRNFQKMRCQVPSRCHR